MFQNYFKTAWRNLVRNKLYSVINVAGLSIGLACCMLIILYNKDEVSYDRFQKYAPDIYRLAVNETTPEGESFKYGITGSVHGPSFKRQIPEIEEFVRVQGETFNIKKGTDVFTQEALKVDSTFFTLFPSFEFAEGNAAAALKDPYSVVLSAEVAAKYFGHASALGKPISIEYDGGFKDFTVSAVTKPSPQNSTIKINLLLPKHVDKNQDDGYINFYLNTFFLLTKNADLKKVETRMNAVFASEAKQQLKEMKDQFGYKSKLNFSLQPFLSIHLSKDYPAVNGLADASNPTYAYMLTGIAIFILLIACINFVNLTVARSLKRSKEIGIRKVIGGERGLLIAQFLGESLLLSFIAFSFALLLVWVSLPLFNANANKVLAVSYLLDVKLVLIYVGLFLLTGFLAGFYPALVLSGFNPVDTLYGRLKITRGAFLQKGLVVLQFSLAVFMIVATMVMYEQFNFLTRQDLGYNDKNLMTINAGRMDIVKSKTFTQELLKNPGIVSAAPRNQGEWFTVMKVNGEQQMVAAMDVMDENYVPTLGLKMVKGRNFSPVFPSDSAASVLVNEAFVKAANWKEPIGQTIDFFTHNHKYQVVGVVKDYHFATLKDSIKPQMFTCDPAMGGYGTMFVRLKPNNIPDAIAHVEKTFKEMFPTKPYLYEFKAASNERQYEKEAKWKGMISFSAILTIFISCIGLFGLATLAAEKRTKEIGIRKVMGASVSAITSLLSINFLQLVLISCAVAFPAVWWLGNKFLQGYAYRIQIGWWMFALAGMVVIFIALATVSYQAIKAAIANPVKSLRTE
jgi:putative ABC transport system permease protein